eukprot:291755_1
MSATKHATCEYFNKMRMAFAMIMIIKYCVVLINRSYCHFTMNYKLKFVMRAAKLADINDATQYDGSPPQIQTISPHLSYSHYLSSNASYDEIHLLQSMTIAGIMMNENDIESSLKSSSSSTEEEEETKEDKK